MGELSRVIDDDQSWSLCFRVTLSVISDITTHIDIK